MKRHEQALLLLKKAAQDEALLDRVLLDPAVSAEIVGFHCQQAAEELLKALLSELGVPFRKTHDLGSLMDLLADSGHPLPKEFENLDALTPFGALYRYEHFDMDISLNREATGAMLQALRGWVERQLALRS